MQARRLFCLLLVNGCLALTACTTPPPRAQTVPALNALPARIELTQVPFYPQTEDQCGPAALAMMLTHAGVTRTPAQMRDEVYLPLRQGSVPIEMVSAVRRTGLTPQQLRPSLHDLLQYVSHGQPATVLMNVRWRLWPQWHYAVVVGYDLKQEHILLRSGLEERQVMSLQEFDAQWAAAERWGLVISPPVVPPQVNSLRVQSPPSD